MPLDLLRVCATLLVALACGLGFAHVLESPAKMAYSASRYIELQKTLYVQWGPPQIGGFLEPIAIGATGLLAFFLWQQNLPFRLPAVGLVALLIAFPLVFFWLVAPTNAAFHAATLSAFPANWADLRANWELGHALVLSFVFDVGRTCVANKLGPP